MKNIAIIHDSYLHVGGAEKVLKYFVSAYPKADIYIPLLKKKYSGEIKTTGRIYTSILSELPFVEKYASILKPLVLLYWETLNLKKYDLIISSSHSFSSKSVNKSKHAKHVSYIHTPPKYLYSELNEMNWIKKLPFSVLFWPLFFLLRKYDYYSAQKPDLLIANSKNVQSRIKKYYNRNSIVIYPPHTVAPVDFKKRKGKYYLFFSRLEKQKGAELVIRTCSQYKLPLVVIGTGSQEKYLKKIASKNIEFTGFITEEEKVLIFAEAKALLYAAIDEDYGLVIPEVLSYGIPVIAYDSGSIREIQSKQTSKNEILLFSEYNCSSLVHAIHEHKKIYKDI